MTALAKNYESFIVWEDGVPTVAYRELLTIDAVSNLPIAALSLPYQRTPREILLAIDIEFEGLTNAEVMNIRLARRAASGDMDATKTIQDRVLGRPKQQIESRSITETYTQYLERLAKDEENLKEANVES